MRGAAFLWFQVLMSICVDGGNIFIERPTTRKVSLVRRSHPESPDTSRTHSSRAGAPHPLSVTFERPFDGQLGAHHTSLNPPFPLAPPQHDNPHAAMRHARLAAVHLATTHTPAPLVNRMLSYWTRPYRAILDPNLAVLHSLANREWAHYARAPHHVWPLGDGRHLDWHTFYAYFHDAWVAEGRPRFAGHLPGVPTDVGITSRFQHVLAPQDAVRLRATSNIKRDSTIHDVWARHRAILGQTAPPYPNEGAFRREALHLFAMLDHVPLRHERPGFEDVAYPSDALTLNALVEGGEPQGPRARMLRVALRERLKQIQREYQMRNWRLSWYGMPEPVRSDP